MALEDLFGAELPPRAGNAFSASVAGSACGWRRGSAMLLLFPPLLLLPRRGPPLRPPFI